MNGWMNLFIRRLTLVPLIRIMIQRKNIFTSVNFEALIITLAVLGGLILTSIIVCCCCCCCKKRQSGPDRDEERYSKRRDEISKRAEERKVERKARHDEIRRKYGLMGDSDHPYSKFENE